MSCGSGEDFLNEYTKGKAELDVWKVEPQKKELINLGIIWGRLV